MQYQPEDIPKSAIDERRFPPVTDAPAKVGYEMIYS
jgi:hypothetical protein